MDFYLAQGSYRFQFPMNPDQVQVQMGPNVENHSVVALGTINTPRGKVPRVYSWQGILPGQARQSQPFVKNWQDPKTLNNHLVTWSEAGTPLQLIITGTPINITVFISKYNPTWIGGMGDYQYSIELTERRQIMIGTAGSSFTAKSTTAKTRAAPPTPKTYTVKSGDTLWGITKKLGVSPSSANVNTLYQTNKSTIGPDQNKIYPGQVLRVPSGW